MSLVPVRPLGDYEEAIKSDLRKKPYGGYKNEQ